jgi:hypothetical protein
MRNFWLERDEDATGVSGTGRVAQGTEYDTGKCALCWLTATSSIAVYDSIEHVQEIHGHQGRTRVVWDAE